MPVVLLVSLRALFACMIVRASEGSLYTASTGTHGISLSYHQYEDSHLRPVFLVRDLHSNAVGAICLLALLPLDEASV